MILLIMDCCSVAEQVVASFDHPRVKVCPFHLASVQTKQTARKLKGLPFFLFLSVLTLGQQIVVGTLLSLRPMTYMPVTGTVN